MSNQFRLAILVTATLAAPTSLLAEEPADRPILASQDDVQKRLGDPSLRLLDTRSQADFARGHIPGSVWVDTKPLHSMTSKPESFRDRDQWEAWIAPLGITPETEVLIVDGKRQLDSARLWGLLR